MSPYHASAETHAELRFQARIATVRALIRKGDLDPYDGLEALAELERLAADAERLQEALERIAEPGDEAYAPRMQRIARAALEASA